MFTVGEFNITTPNTRSNLEFEKYCKDEGLNSIQIRREIYSLYTIKRINFFKNLLNIVKKNSKISKVIKSN